VKERIYACSAKRNVKLCACDVQDGSGYLERKELDNFLVDLLLNHYGVRSA